MTTPFDPKDRMWEVRVQPRDIISYAIDEPDGTVKRRIGEVGDLYSTVGTAGRITFYLVHGANWFDVEEIDNYNDPKAVEDALTLTRQDMRGFAKIIVEGITDRIRNSKTVADGRPISENSK